MLSTYILMSQHQQWAGREGLLRLAGGLWGLHEMYQAALCQQPGHTSLPWVRQGQQEPTKGTQGARSLSDTGHYIASGHRPRAVFTSLSVVFKMLITATKMTHFVLNLLTSD